MLLYMGCVCNKTTNINEMNINTISKEKKHIYEKELDIIDNELNDDIFAKLEPIELVKMKLTQRNKQIPRRDLDDEQNKTRIKNIYNEENNKMKKIYH